MANTINVQLGQRGVLTLPKVLRRNYHLKPGDQFTLLDIDGVFILAPGHSRVDALAEKITGSLLDQGESLENMLVTLREEREQYDADS